MDGCNHAAACVAEQNRYAVGGGNADTGVCFRRVDGINALEGCLSVGDTFSSKGFVDPQDLGAVCLSGQNELFVGYAQCATEHFAAMKDVLRGIAAVMRNIKGVVRA